MQTDLFDRYEALDAEFKTLELKKAELRAQILKAMIDSGGESIVGKAGTFSLGHKVTWEYTPKVDKLEERLKLARLTEQKKGQAKSFTKEYLLYTEKKI